MLIPTGTWEKIRILLRKHRVVAIGEIHGVVENIMIESEIIDNLRKEKPIVVGFEYPQELIGELSKDFDEVKTSPLAKILINDGKFSREHYLFLKRLIVEGVRIFGFDMNLDESDMGISQKLDWRDNMMAKKVNAELSRLSENQLMVLVTGDLHFQTRLQELMYPNTEGEIAPVKYEPMCGLVKVDSILALHLRYLSGSFFNRQIKTMPKISMIKENSFREKDDLVELDIEVAHPIRES